MIDFFSLSAFKFSPKISHFFTVLFNVAFGNFSEMVVLATFQNIVIGKFAFSSYVLNGIKLKWFKSL